jgi:hypothetical protein
VDHIWTSDPEPNGEHPIVALVAVVAILLAILLISWAGIEVHGTSALQATLTEPEMPTPPRSHQERQVEEAVTSSRFATGLSP